MQRLIRGWAVHEQTGTADQAAAAAVCAPAWQTWHPAYLLAGLTSCFLVLLCDTQLLQGVAAPPPLPHWRVTVMQHLTPLLHLVLFMKKAVSAEAHRSWRSDMFAYKPHGWDRRNGIKSGGKYCLHLCEGLNGWRWSASKFTLELWSVQLLLLLTQQRCLTS